MDNFKRLNLKSSYETGKDDLIEEFYAPVLRCATSYDRIAGFFSSSCLAIAAKGIVGFITHQGKMRLIACPRLDSKDVEILEKVSDDPTKFLEEKINLEFENIEDGFQNNHIMALGWMVANGYLEIRIALVNSRGKFYTEKQIEQTGIFHQKVGILTDAEGNKISFSGSINETASGWLNNVEEFKVFKSWNEENKYLMDDERKFQEFWENNRANVHTYSLPESVKKKLIEKSKEFEVEQILVKHYKKYMIQRKSVDALNLFFYQKEAVKEWRNNAYKLLFQMATGTGKTRTALGCMAELMLTSEKLIVIVSCPQGTLSLQWRDEIEISPLRFEKKLIIDGTNKNWKADLQEVILRVSTGFYNTVVIFTTHITSAKNAFTETIDKSSDKIKYLFVGDEAHGLGASESRKALLQRYNYRVGLSATPSRWFDENGTQTLDNYFGNNSFEFTINDALTTINPATGKTFLVPYMYNLEFVDLTEEELTQYQKISLEVKKLSNFSGKSDEYADRMERLLFKRASLIKAAENKYYKLDEIISHIEAVQDLIIFVSSEQKERVMTLLYKKRIAAHEFTQAVGTTPEEKYDGLTERQHIIKCFKAGYYKVLVAIKCLDEGIDIPSARNAILMASSTNPREYVQRIGRVIRQAPGKNDANIWDITIRPCADKLAVPELQEFETKICEKEKARIYDISENAKNNVEALKILFEEMGD